MADVNVIKRRTTGVSEDTGDLVKIDMENISPASFSTALAATTAVTAPAALTLTVEFANGTVYTLAGAYVVGEANFSSEEGKVSMEFNGNEGDWSR